MAAKGKLSAQHAKFVQEYLVDLNATGAYKRAGYKATGNAAESAASRLLRNVKVQEAIKKAQANRAGRLEITADRVLKEYAKIAFFDIGTVLNFTGEEYRMKPPSEVPEDSRQALASVKVKRYLEGTGDDARTVEVTEFKPCSKEEALGKLAKHLGMLIDRVADVNPDGTAREPIRFIETVYHANKPTNEPINSDRTGAVGPAVDPASDREPQERTGTQGDTVQPAPRPDAG